jgi:hypothetical protein
MFSIQDPVDGAYLLFGQCELLLVIAASVTVWFQYLNK